MANIINQLYKFRGFIVGSVKRDFQARYRNSLLGTLWTILTPIATIAIYLVVFSKIMQARLPGVEDSFAYGIYLCAGILTWGMFSEVITTSLNMFLQNANLLKKLNFPKLCLPMIVVFGSSINLFIVLIIFMFFLLITGRLPDFVLLGLIPIIALQILLAISIGLLFGVVNVFFRDVSHFSGILLQLWFWLTPIVYPINILPESVQKIVLMNPMSAIVISYQNIFVYGQWPTWHTLTQPLVVTLVIAAIAGYFYNKRANEMVDEL
jgi:lipopolysaccharide transport system permease protein